MKYKNRYVWLDLIRGIAAILVCGGHLRAAMFDSYSGIINANILEKGFYFVTGLGHQAVIVFFVLSGFLIGGSILSHRQDFRFGEYLFLRLTRLWVVLIPALIFTFFIDRIIAGRCPQLLSGQLYALLNSGPSEGYSISLFTFIANVAFLQSIYSPVFGSNGPLWSLANEFWYYLLFPLLLISIGEIRSSMTKRVISIGMLLIISLFIARNLLVGFIVWLFGVVVYLVYSKRATDHSIWAMGLSIILFLGSIVDSKVHFFENVFHISSDLVIGFCFSLLLVSIQSLSIPGQYGNYVSRFAKWLSEISYTLYLFHFPLVLLIYAVFYSKTQIALNIYGITQYIFWLLLLIVSSYLLWWIFERNTNRVRKHLQSYQIKSRDA